MKPASVLGYRDLAHVLALTAAPIIADIGRHRLASLDTGLATFKIRDDER